MHAAISRQELDQFLKGLWLAKGNAFSEAKIILGLVRQHPSTPISNVFED
jgi:hypothetical protein